MRKSFKNVLMLTSILTLGGVATSIVTGCDQTTEYTATFSPAAGASLYVNGTQITAADTTLTFSQGETVTLTFVVDQDYELTTVSVVDASGSEVSVTGSGNTYTFTMPASNVSVTYVATSTATFAISTDYSSNDCMAYTSARTSKAGLTITITVMVYNGRYLIENGVTVTTASGAAVEVTAVSATQYTFVMPAEDVTVTVTCGQYDYYLTVADSENFNISVDVDTTEALHYGDTITVTVTSKGSGDDEYAVSGITVLDEDESMVSYSQQGYGVYTFRMPASDVTLDAEGFLMTEDYQVNNVINSIVESNDYLLEVYATDGEYVSGVEATDTVSNTKEFGKDTYFYARSMSDTGYFFGSGWHNTTDNKVGSYYLSSSATGYAVADYYYYDETVSDYHDIVLTLDDFDEYATDATSVYWEIDSDSSENAQYFASYFASLCDIDPSYGITGLYLQVIESGVIYFKLNTYYSYAYYGYESDITYEGYLYTKSALGGTTTYIDLLTGLDSISYVTPDYTDVSTEWYDIISDMNSDSFYVTTSQAGYDYQFWYVYNDDYKYIGYVSGGEMVQFCYEDTNGNIVYESATYGTETIYTAEQLTNLGITAEEALQYEFNYLYFMHPALITALDENLAHLVVSDNWYMTDQSTGEITYLHNLDDWHDLYGVRSNLEYLLGFGVDDSYSGTYYTLGILMLMEAGESKAEDAITIGATMYEDEGSSIDYGGVTYYAYYTGFGETSSVLNSLFTSYTSANE